MFKFSAFKLCITDDTIYNVTSTLHNQRPTTINKANIFFVCLGWITMAIKKEEIYCINIYVYELNDLALSRKASSPAEL